MTAKVSIMPGSKPEPVAAFEVLGARQSLVSKSQAARDAAKALAKNGSTTGKPVYVLDSGSQSTIRADSSLTNSTFDAITPMLRVSSAGRSRPVATSSAIASGSATTEPPTYNGHSTAATASKASRPSSAPSQQQQFGVSRAGSGSTVGAGSGISNGSGVSSNGLWLGPASTKERPMSPLHRAATMREFTLSNKGWPAASSQVLSRPMSASGAGKDSSAAGGSHLTVRRSWSLGSQLRGAGATGNTAVAVGMSATVPGARGGSDDGRGYSLSRRSEEVLASMFRHLDMDAARGGVLSVTTGAVGSTLTLSSSPNAALARPHSAHASTSASGARQAPSQAALDAVKLSGATVSGVAPAGSTSNTTATRSAAAAVAGVTASASRAAAADASRQPASSPREPLMATAGSSTSPARARAAVTLTPDAGRVLRKSSSSGAASATPFSSPAQQLVTTSTAAVTSQPPADASNGNSTTRQDTAPTSHVPSATTSSLQREPTPLSTSPGAQPAGQSGATSATIPHALGTLSPQAGTPGSDHGWSIRKPAQAVAAAPAAAATSPAPSSPTHSKPAGPSSPFTTTGSAASTPPATTSSATSSSIGTSAAVSAVAQSPPAASAPASASTPASAPATDSQSQTPGSTGHASATFTAAASPRSPASSPGAVTRSPGSGLRSNLTLDMTKIKNPLADSGPAKALNKVQHLGTVSPAAAALANAAATAGSPVRVTSSPKVGSSPSKASPSKAAALESTAAPSAAAALLGTSPASSTSSAAATPAGGTHALGGLDVGPGGAVSPGMRLIPALTASAGIGSRGATGAMDVHLHLVPVVTARLPVQEPLLAVSAMAPGELKQLMSKVPGAAALPHRSCEVVGELLSESTQLMDQLGIDLSWLSNVLIHSPSPVHTRLSWE